MFWTLALYLANDRIQTMQEFYLSDSAPETIVYFSFFFLGQCIELFIYRQFSGEIRDALNIHWRYCDRISLFEILGLLNNHGFDKLTNLLLSTLYACASWMISFFLILSGPRVWFRVYLRYCDMCDGCRWKKTDRQGM